MEFINNTPFVYYRDDTWYLCGCGKSCQTHRIAEHMSVEFPGFCQDGIRVGKNRLYQCICGSDFDNQDDCEQHVYKRQSKCMEYALKSRSRECNICSLEFAGIGELKRHLKTKTHLEKVNGTYKDISLHCKVCDIDCSTKVKMEIHLKTKKHLARAESPPLELECKICNIKCLSQKQIKAHLETKKHLKRVTQTS